MPASRGRSAYSQSGAVGPLPGRRRGQPGAPADWSQAGIDGVVGGFARRPGALSAARARRGGDRRRRLALLRQFQSGLTNQRVDGYGQDRIALTREVLAAVRRAIGPASVALRLSGDELAPWAGITPEIGR